MSNCQCLHQHLLGRKTQGYYGSNDSVGIIIAVWTDRGELKILVENTATGQTYETTPPGVTLVPID